MKMDTQNNNSGHTAVITDAEQWAKVNSCKLATLVGFVFSFSFGLNLIIEAVWGHRVPAKVELEGLDIPEMGALGYPEFELKPEPVLAQ